LAVVGDLAFAADKDVNEPPKSGPAKQPVIIKPTPKLQLKPVTTRHATTQPVKAEKMLIATVQLREVVNQFKMREHLDKKFQELRKEAADAKKENNQQKMIEIQMQMQKIDADFRKSLSEAVEFVAQRDHFDVVVGDTLYKGASVELPDLTDAIAEQLNATASAPASEAAESKPASLK